jgi:hypothetical protein
LSPKDVVEVLRREGIGVDGAKEPTEESNSAKTTAEYAPPPASRETAGQPADRQTRPPDQAQQAETQARQTDVQPANDAPLPPKPRGAPQPGLATDPHQRADKSDVDKSDGDAKYRRGKLSTEPGTTGKMGYENAAGAESNLKRGDKTAAGRTAQDDAERRRDTKAKIDIGGSQAGAEVRKETAHGGAGKSAVFGERDRLKAKSGASEGESEGVAPRDVRAKTSGAGSSTSGALRPATSTASGDDSNNSRSKNKDSKNKDSKSDNSNDEAGVKAGQSQNLSAVRPATIVILRFQQTSGSTTPNAASTKSR